MEHGDPLVGIIVVGIIGFQINKFFPSIAVFTRKYLSGKL